MSNYDPNGPSSGQGQTEQVFCPNCKGGNSPEATRCQWCGTALTSAPSGAPSGQQPMQQPPQQGYAPSPQYPQEQYPTQQSQQGYAPPTYQQAPQPAAPPRRTGRNILLIVGGLVLVLVLACVLLFGSIFAGVFGLTQPVADAGDRFMSSLRDGNYQRAYDMMTPALQAEFGDVDTLASQAEGNRPTSWNFTSRNINNNVGELVGTATLEDGQQADVELVFDKVGNDWKLSGVNINPK